MDSRLSRVYAKGEQNRPRVVPIFRLEMREREDVEGAEADQSASTPSHRRSRATAFSLARPR